MTGAPVRPSQRDGCRRRPCHCLALATKTDASGAPATLHPKPVAPPQPALATTRRMPAAPLSLSGPRNEDGCQWRPLTMCARAWPRARSPKRHRRRGATRRARTHRRLFRASLPGWGDSSSSGSEPESRLVTTRARGAQEGGVRLLGAWGRDPRERGRVRALGDDARRTVAHSSKTSGPERSTSRRNRAPARAP